MTKKFKSLTTDQSVSSQFNTTNIYQVIDSKRDYKLNNLEENQTINCIKEVKYFRTKKQTYELNLVPMNAKTDELVLFCLLSINDFNFEESTSTVKISVRDLAAKMGIAKKKQNDKDTKERIYNSLDKHIECNIKVLCNESQERKGNFNILSSWKQEKDGKETILIVNFVNDFLNFFTSTNQSFFEIETLLNLKLEYSKVLFPLINNIDSKNNKIQLYSSPVRNKFNDIKNINDKSVKLTPHQRKKINAALKELATNKIITGKYKLNIDDSISLTKIKEDNSKNTIGTTVESILLMKEETTKQKELKMKAIENLNKGNLSVKNHFF